MKKRITFICIAILFFAMVIWMMNLLSVNTNSMRIFYCHMVWDPIESKFDCIGNIQPANCVCIIPEQEN